MEQTVEGIRRRLENALRGPLPGSRAHRLMAPVPRPGWDPRSVPPHGRPAAVLVLIYPLGFTKAEPEVAGPCAGLLFTERTDAVESHRRQISFPGGVIETDESPEQAALREAFEEISLPPEMPHVLGRLSPLWIPATGYTVTPVIATSDVLPELRPNPHEVERIIEAPLADLLRPGAVQMDEAWPGGRWTRVRYFDIGRSRLWGATAMMTAELLTLLGWKGPGL